jgi:glycosyltransferase involved in cell wall biosynthesis
VLKVLFLTNSLTGGGAERAMNLVVNQLFELGFDVALIPINESGEDYVKIQCEVFPLRRKWKDGLISTYRSSRRFSQIAKDFEPDFIVGTCELPELFIATHRLKCRVIIVEEAKEPWRNRRLLGQLVRRILQVKKVIWVASSGHLEIWPFGFMPAWTIPNALTIFQDAKGASNVSTDTAHNLGGRLAYVGRFSPEKRPDWFIHICERSKVNAICFGTGDMEEELKNQSSLGHSKIEFRGFVSNPWSELLPDDLLIVPSASEGDGLVVIEAISRQIPILVSDIPEFRYFGLSDKHYCSTMEDFADRINQFSESFTQLNVDEGVRLNIMNSRSIKTIGKQWVELFTTKGFE